MKKFSRFCKLAVMAGVLGWAVQSPAQVGVEGGLGFLNNDAANSTSTTQGEVGVFGEWGMGAINFRPEVLYQTSTPNFINVPLMFQAKADMGPLKPFIFLGPEFDLNVGSTTLTKTFDLAIDGGVGAEYWINDKVSVGVNWRYSFGLLNMNNSALVPGSIHTRNMYLLGAIGVAL